MRIVRLASVILGFALAAAPALVASDQSAPETKKAAPAVSAASGQFAALKGINTVPMTSSELTAVKGQHVHFVTISNGKLHLAGDIKTENNWSNEWGGSDGKPVAPSYHGLCVAHGNGQIFIPTGPPGTPVTLQCPAGS
jgi:hypothetical protein